MSERSRESGNMIFFILLAIVLIGLVTAALRSNGIESASISNEDMTIKVTQVRQNATELEHAVALVLQNDVSESDLSFASVDAPSDYGVYNTNPPAEVFNVKGGGAVWRAPPADINDGSGWEFFGNTALPGVGSDRADLVAVLPNVSKAFCDKVNQITGQTTQTPTDGGSCVNAGQGNRFKGVFSSIPQTMDVNSFTVQPAGEACVQCDGPVYEYYHVLMAR